MDAGIFARQLTEALDNLAAGISIDPEDIDGIAGARVLSFADAEYLTDDAGFEITAPRRVTTPGHHLAARPPARLTPRQDHQPAARRTLMDTRIMIRDGGPYGPDLSLPAAIARLCDGEQVTVTPVDASTPGGDPRGEPRQGFDITVYPARTAYTRLEPPKVNWAGIGSRPAADAALFAGTLTLASQLVTYASLGQATTGQAAAIGEGDGRDAARRALGASTSETCQAIVKGLDDSDHMVYDLFPTPALSGEHGIGYDAVDLAAGLGLDPDSDAMTAATEAYFTAAGEAFWAEAERIARERVTPAARTPGRSSR